MIASYLLDANAIVASARGARARARRLQGAARGRRLRPRREGRVVRADSGRGARSTTRASDADLALQLAPTLARSAPTRTDSTRSTSSSSSRSSRCSSTSSAPASASTRRRSRRRRSAHRRGARRAWPRRIYELSGEEFNINSPKKLSEDPVRQARAADRDDPPDDEDEGAVDGVRSARGAGLTHELPRLVLEWREPAEAEGHLHRCAAAAGEPATRAASTPASTRRSPRRAG